MDYIAIFQQKISYSKRGSPILNATMSCLRLVPNGNTQNKHRSCQVLMKLINPSPALQISNLYICVN